MTRRLRPPGSRQVTTSFGKVHVNGGSVLLRISTGRRSCSSPGKADVSRSVSVVESGNKEAGVFTMPRPAFRFHMEVLEQGLQTIGLFPPRSPRPRWLDPAQ